MPNATLKFEAIGTHWQIDIEHNPPLLNEADLLIEIRERIEKFENNYSRFRSESLVTEMSKKAGTYTLPEDAGPLLNLYHHLYILTQGAFTPLIGQVLADAGYDAAYSFTTQKLSTPPSWDEVIELTLPTIIIKKPALLDFGAAGKGYLVTIISKIFEKHGFESFCINAGGDIFYKNNQGKKLRVGLEHPQNSGQVIGVAELLNNSICGSAGNRRAWANFNHIIDPRKLTSPQDILAIWVVAKDTAIADALATCLFFLPSSKFKSDYEFEYLIMFADYSVEISSKFPGEIFTPEK
ncbi:MAG: FAD:protein FMN transferase [Patescibacteria group bacterium]|jgi:thiamine biosynthesis lipoprotein